MKEIISGIYEIRNTVNGHRYIGSSVDIHKRWGKHRRELRGGKHHSSYLQNAWKKYGEGCFEFSVLEKCSSLVISLMEQSYFDTLRPEYNMTLNAISPMLNKKHSNETKVRMSESHRNISEETRRKMSDSGKGRKVSRETREKISKKRIGKVLSLDTKKKIGAARSGRKNSEKQRIALYNANKRRVFSNETRRKISNALKGRVFSLETILKMSTSAKKKVFSEKQRLNMSIAQKRRWDKEKIEKEN